METLNDRPVALAYLGLRSPRASDWITYGPAVIGFQLAEPGADGTVYLRTDDRHHRVAVHPGDADALLYVGWEMQGRDELDAAIDRIKQHSVDVTWATDEELADRRVRRMAWFADLDGFRHEFCYGQESSPKTFLPGRPMSGFEAEDLGLGHLAIGVSDLEAARRFYLDVVGLSFTDEIDAHVPLAFFHVSARHHSLAVGESPGRCGLFHLGLTVNDIDDVGTGYDQAVAHDVPIRRSLGRHVNDRVVSFYLGTPSGFDIEVGWASTHIEPHRHTTTVFKRTSIWGHHQLSPSTCLPPAPLGPR